MELIQNSIYTSNETSLLFLVCIPDKVREMGKFWKKIDKVDRKKKGPSEIKQEFMKLIYSL